MTSPYRPQTFAAPIDLDLSRNEGRPRISTIAIDSDDGSRLTSRYPDTTRLRAMIAARHGVEAERVLVTAGGDDALFRCFLFAAGATVVSTTPSFEMIRRYADQTRSTLMEIPWWSGDFPVADLLEAPERYMAVIVSPNNPTGAVITPADLRKISDDYVMVVLDAAYAEFADEDLTPATIDLGNVVVVRTLSKAFGLAGLRVGYALGPAELIARIGAFGSPYSVSSLSTHLACEVLADESGSRRYLGEVVGERERLVSLLGRLGGAPLPSQANFVLATTVDAEWVVSAAAALGVGLRRFPDRDDLSGCVRITLPGDEADYRRLAATLRAVLAPEAIVIHGEPDEFDPATLQRVSMRIPIGFTMGSDVEAIRHTMSDVGAECGWLVGRTSDELASARAAGLVPIGLIGGEGEPVAMAPTARVIGSLEELGEVLDAAKI